MRNEGARSLTGSIPGSRSVSNAPSCSSPASCVVCGLDDARAMTTARLADGSDAAVCGTHYLVHARMSAPAANVTELRAMLREKRRRTERRGQMALVDELGAQLAEAFGPQRRTGGDRRR